MGCTVEMGTLACHKSGFFFARKSGRVYSPVFLFLSRCAALLCLFLGALQSIPLNRPCRMGLRLRLTPLSRKDTRRGHGKTLHSRFTSQGSRFRCAVRNVRADFRIARWEPPASVTAMMSDVRMLQKQEHTFVDFEAPPLVGSAGRK